MTVAKGLAERVECLIKEAGSQNDFARAAGVSSAAVSNWRRGVIPYKSTLHEVAERLAVSLEWLTEGKGDQGRELESFRTRLQSASSKRKQSIVNQNSRMISDFQEGGSVGPGSSKGTVSTEMAPHLSDRMIVDLINEITSNEELPAEERLKWAKPFQDELSRRIKDRTS